MDHEQTPMLCVNRCGFFGSPANMNMCSKCYKDTVLEQEREAKAAASSMVNGPSPSAVVRIRGREIVPQPSKPACKTREGGVNRCNACKKRVGLTAFKCRCGHLFCGSHRYTDKHDCPFDYSTVGREAIAKANPVVKAEKLDKI